MSDADHDRFFAQLQAEPTYGVAGAYLTAVGTADGVAHAAGWAAAAEPVVREVGYVVLGKAALDDPKAREALLELVPAGVDDPDVDVRETVAEALANLGGEERGLPWLLRLINDTDDGVRMIAIGGVPIALTAPAADHPAVRVLTGLLDDPSADVRDWAAFALGTQLEVDSPEIRAALHRLLTGGDGDTDEVYPAAEAAVGLARRGDPEVWAAVNERLTEPELGSLWLEAARDLGDARLLPRLLALRADDGRPDDPWVQMLEEAIAACRR